MLSVAKLTAGAEDYYLLSVAHGLEDYYTGAGEAPGYWTGKGAQALGLDGEVTPEDLHILLSGLSPLDASPIRSAHAGRKTVAGFDLTFSAPKSVSLMWGLTTDAIAHEVREAHDQAVAAALAYIEDHALRVRRGHGGAESCSAEGVIAAAFRHRSSRAGDPQLHTHVLVANATRGADGEFSSPDGRLFYLHARAAGYLYQCVLRNELASRLGVAFTPVINGAAEIAGVDGDLVRAFSTRRAEIEARLANVGDYSAQAASRAALVTRRPKEQSTFDESATSRTLAERWREQARALGHDPGALALLAGPARHLDISGALLQGIVDALIAPGGLTEKLSTFERRDVVRMAAASLPDGADFHVVDHIVGAVLAHPSTVALGSFGRGAEQRLTTTELLDVETALVELAITGATATRGTVRPSVLAEVIATKATISAEQMAMVRQLVTSGSAVEVVVGAAGTGKTFALSACREIWEREGYRVKGAALAARAARGLEESAKIPSTTLAALDAEIKEDRDYFGPSSILVIDEAAMVGTRMLSRVVTRAVNSGAKVVLVGDHHQLPELDSGGAFGAIAREVGAIELVENRRQVNAWEREALGLLRSGNVAQALHTYEANQRVRDCNSMDDAMARLAADWFEERSAFSYKDARMFAIRHADVDALNVEARSLLRENALLGPIVYSTSSGQEFAYGDEVICLKNDRRLEVRNGTRGRVVSADLAGLTIATDAGRLRLPHAYLEAGHLAYGYATTVHKAQGATVDTAFVLASGKLYREAAYVAMSRAREASYLYTVPDTLGLSIGSDHDLSIESAHGNQLLAPNLTLLDTLSQSRAKTMATDELTARHPSRPKDAGRYNLSGEPEGIERVLDQPRPRHLAAALDRRPPGGRASEMWDRAAQQIESYRNRTGCSGPSSLGPAPSDRVAKMEHVSAMDAILEYRRFAERERAPERDRSLDRGISL